VKRVSTTTHGRATVVGFFAPAAARADGK